MTLFRVQSEVRHTLEIKKSQFITWLKSVQSRQEAMAYLEQAKQAYPDARHYCFAYVMGQSANSMTAAMSDDGEPSGTAGKPMLNVLQHKPVCNVMAIVIRYFGGTKLGAGGLVRAYSQAVEQAYGLAQLEEIIETLAIKVQCDFAEEQWLRHQLSQVEGEIESVDYDQAVAFVLTLPKSQITPFCQQLDSRSIHYELKI